MVGNDDVGIAEAADAVDDDGVGGAERRTQSKTQMLSGALMLIALRLLESGGTIKPTGISTVSTGKHDY